MNRLLGLLACIFLFTQPGAAERPWFYPRQAAKSYVNPYLTPQKVLTKPWQHRYEGQLVLWIGKAENVKSEGQQSLDLKTGSGNIPVRFSRTVKNLQADRGGAQVAIKGRVRKDVGGVYIEGRSVIPWRPSGGFNSKSSIIEQWVHFQRPNLPQKTREKIASAIEREAQRNRIDPLFLTALIQVESGFDPNAVSVSGAQGLGQLMPATAAGLGVNPRDISDNIRGCAKMIGGLVHRYEHRNDGKALALASYNAGPTLVANIQRVPSYEQTINYVYFIGKLYTSLSKAQKNLKRAS